MDRAKRVILVLIYLGIFLFSVVFLFLVRQVVFNAEMENIKMSVEDFLNTEVEEAGTFVYMLITALFIVAVLSTLLMYMNFFFLENPKFEKRVAKGIEKDVHEHRKRLRKKMKKLKKKKKK